MTFKPFFLIVNLCFYSLKLYQIFYLFKISSFFKKFFMEFFQSVNFNFASNYKCSFAVNS